MRDRYAAQAIEQQRRGYGELTMSTSDTQSHLFGDPSGNSIDIETSGRVIRPLFNVPAAIVGEAKLTFDEDGLHTSAVDPSNVALVELDVNPEAFENYDLADEGFTTGVNLSRVRRQLKRARMGKTTDDAVTMDVDGTRVLVTTERDYEHTTLTQTNEVLTIDPDALREEPGVPDLNLSWEATIDVQAFGDAVSDIDTVSDHVEVLERNGHLVMAGDDGSDRTGEYATVADFGAIAEEYDSDYADGGEHSTFTLDYLTDMADGLKKAKIDELTLRWGDKLPIFLSFARHTDDGEIAYEGRYMMAPRIRSD